MTIEQKVMEKLASMPSEVSKEEQERDERAAIGTASWAKDYQDWIDRGADLDDALEPEVLAIADLPDSQFQLVAGIAGCVDQKTQEDFVKSVEPLALRELEVWYETLKDQIIEEGEDEADPRDPALRPRPRKKGRGFVNDW
ncbi:hypothetical protein [Solilutibacter silvestris]|uniref:Uncharacterized protein n=1 Tax=Solilutibacter silvestris TaxID=1645665 RepID=A0A2K1Q472_9GAMM|nr:hypothetical protein [Lysobacter silvestris]PNS09824.1 hypothetical protein Lysil_1453 [Lysobacter silvestris]